jgi:hypothetical protein
MSQNFKDRIVHFGVKPASAFLANPDNPRRHPEMQRRAVKASLETLGWIAPVIELTNGYLLDGHERVWQASALGDDTPVPYIIVDLDETEARQALATFDYVGCLAQYDKSMLADLLSTVQTDSEDIRLLLDNMAEVYLPDNIVPPENFPAYDENIDTKYHCPKCGYTWNGNPDE